MFTTVIRVAVKHQTRFRDTCPIHNTLPMIQSRAKRKSAMDRTNIGWICTNKDLQCIILYNGCV